MNATLHAALADLLQAFAEHLLEGRELVVFEPLWDGATITLRVHMPTGDVEVCGHLSAWKRLAGCYWAATLARAETSVCLPTLLRRPGGGGVHWEPMAALLADPRVVHYVEHASQFLQAEGLHEEAQLCRCSIRIAEGTMDGVPSKTLREARAARRRLPASGALKVLAPFLASSDAMTRLEALACVCNELVSSSPGNELTFHEGLRAHMVPSRQDTQPLLHEAAVALAERWVPTLMVCGAYVEAIPLLDALVDYGVSVATNLRRRHQCHLALGHDAEAADDARRVAWWVRGASFGPWSGPEDFAHFEVSALAQAAEAQLCFAEGALPYTDRVMTGKQKRSLAAPAEHRQRARDYLRTAFDYLDAHADVDESVVGDLHGSLARLHENEGDLAGALQHYRRANDLVVEGGVAWHRDRYRKKKLELERQLAGAVSAAAAPTANVPLAYDKEWLLADDTNEASIAEAITAWGNPWAEFSPSYEAALETPLAALMLEKLGPTGLDWNVVQTFDLAAYRTYQDYTASNAGFILRFRDLIDAHKDTPAYEHWYWVLNTKSLSVLFGWEWDNRGRDVSVVPWKDHLKSWLSGLLASDGIRHADVLCNVPSHVWPRIAAWYREVGPISNLDHYLCWCVWDSTRDAASVRRVHAIYHPLLTGFWKKMAAPSPAYLATVQSWERGGSPALTQALHRFVHEYGKRGRSSDRAALAEKWLWPWALLWDPTMEPLLRDHLAGRWDPERLKPKARQHRLDLYAWLLTQVDAPALKADFEAARARLPPAP